MQSIRRWLTQSLSSRLTLLVLLVTCLTWLIFSATLLLEVHDETNKLLDSQLESYTDLLWHYLNDEDDALPTSKNPFHNNLGLVYSLYDAHQILLSSNTSAPLPYQSTATEETFTLTVDGKDWRLCVHNKLNKQLIVGVPLSYHHHILYELIKHLGQTTLLALLILIPTLRLAVRRGLNPLRFFARELATREAQNLNPLAFDAPEEIQPLRDRLNELFAQVRAAFARERRFTADAAHELRTPLAGLRVHIELAQQSPRAETRAKALTKAIEGVDRTTRLINQLLALSRLEQGTELAFTSVSLTDLATQTLNDAGLTPKPPHLVVTDPQPIRGNPDLILLLLRNLLDNALRYGSTPEGSDDVGVGIGGGIGIDILGSTISVFDRGPGVTEETLQRLGERFYRPAGQTKPGAGLGISIAQQIAQLHGARMTYSNQPEGGFRVTIEFLR